METHFKQNSNYIEVNEVFVDFNEETKRLENEINFANISLNVLLKCKTLSERIYKKYDKNIDSEDKQMLKQLDEEFNSMALSVDEFMKQNDCIKNEEQNIFEIKDNDIIRESNEEPINESTVMSTEDMDIISEMDVKSEPIFEIKDMTNSQSTDVSPHIEINREINVKTCQSSEHLINSDITKVIQCESCDEIIATQLELNVLRKAGLGVTRVNKVSQKFLMKFIYT